MKVEIDARGTKISIREMSQKERFAVRNLLNKTGKRFSLVLTNESGRLWDAENNTDFSMLTQNDIDSSDFHVYSESIVIKRLEALCKAAKPFNAQAYIKEHCRIVSKQEADELMQKPGNIVRSGGYTVMSSSDGVTDKLYHHYCACGTYPGNLRGCYHDGVTDGEWAVLTLRDIVVLDGFFPIDGSMNIVGHQLASKDFSIDTRSMIEAIVDSPKKKEFFTSCSNEVSAWWLNFFEEQDAKKLRPQG